MHQTIKKLIEIENQIKAKLDNLKGLKLPKIIAVTKTFPINEILPLVEYGHLNYGENKVQEAVDKWTNIKERNQNIKLHMIGKLQTNKVKMAVKLFDFIHSVDSEKLAKKIADEQLKIDKNIKIFIQVNIGLENQKAGINIENIGELVDCCRKLNLNLCGLMCIPPANIEPDRYFEQMNKINSSYNFTELSMGMSSDYIQAALNNATYLRIGSSIFGKRF
jgi:pyridoxal phosphate enzyme (YggS family)